MKLGDSAVVSSWSGELVVAVSDYQKRRTCYYTTASPGNVLVGVGVGYAAVSGSPFYGMFDWVAHDQNDYQYEVTFSTCYNNSLGAGNLMPGKGTGGWILFEVPKTTKHLWVDYKNTGDSWRLW